MSTNEKMTVHKALAELKVIDSRIMNAIAGSVFVAANKHSNQKIGGKTIPDYKDEIKSQSKKVEDLINRRNALKRAVVLSNASTTVVIGGKTYTVAEAIDMKNHGMDSFKVLLRELTNQMNAAMRVINANSGESVERKAEKYIMDIIASQPKDAKMAVDSEAMKLMRKDYIDNNTYDLIDPIDTAKKIQDLDTMITEFETEVDAALSVSNALTVIDFTY